MVKIATLTKPTFIPSLTQRWRISGSTLNHWLLLPVLNKQCINSRINFPNWPKHWWFRQFIFFTNSDCQWDPFAFLLITIKLPDSLSITLPLQYSGDQQKPLNVALQLAVFPWGWKILFFLHSQNKYNLQKEKFKGTEKKRKETDFSECS